MSADADPEAQEDAGLLRHPEDAQLRDMADDLHATMCAIYFSPHVSVSVCVISYTMCVHSVCASGLHQLHAFSP